MHIRYLGVQSYLAVWQDMKTFTSTRTQNTDDELWLLEHSPVYTQGQAGKAEHMIVQPSSIPLIQSDRGGQITYHGPGQLIAYVLIDIRRKNMAIRTLVSKLETLVILTLSDYQMNAETINGAPGVYVSGKKIASIGLRVKNGCTYHGLALNVAMDLSPFSNINPCGYSKLEMTQIQNYQPNITIEEVGQILANKFITLF
ncbi:MAG: lipoyl(octanoyl) transferase LipB [Legionella sp.]